MVRTDSKNQKLDAFVGQSRNDQTSLTTPTDEKSKDKTKRDDPGSKAKRRDIKLNSVLQLREEVDSNLSDGIKDIIKNHTFVGCVSERHALIQHQTRLYLANTSTLSKDLFYQIMLNDFGNFGILRLQEPLPIRDLVMLALASEESGWTPADGPKEDMADYVSQFLVNKSEMLQDYFSIEVDETGNLLTLPMLLDQYVPCLDELPLYILKLATEVDWESEEECFKTLCKETSEFYGVRKSVSELQEQMEVDEEQETNVSWKWTIEHVIYPALRQTLMPPSSMENDRTLIQLANLPDLYKVFERC